MEQDEFFQRYSYNITEDHLGEGGFGKVFKAFDDILDRNVAIKIAEVKKGMESLSLLKEVELAESLPKHRNIAHYESCYRFTTRHGVFDYGILQYYPAGNLSQLIKTKKLDLTQKESIANEIIEGITHLHKHNVVHRDLKSSNILIAERANGQLVPKIADFGLSKQIGDHQNSYFSNSFGGGSLLYAAPEQLDAGQIRKNVDLWSLGVILYELFLEQVPFLPSHDISSETGRVELVNTINNGVIPADIDTIPGKWRALIKACLIPNPAERVKDIDQVKSILDGTLEWNDYVQQPVEISTLEGDSPDITEVAVVSSEDKTSPARPVKFKVPIWLLSAIGGAVIVFLLLNSQLFTPKIHIDNLSLYHHELKGKVTNSKGMALAGAIVTLPDTAIDFKTDSLGRFDLTLPLNVEDITISKEGFSDKKIAVKPSNSQLTILDDCLNLSIDSAFVKRPLTSDENRLLQNVLEYKNVVEPDLENVDPSNLLKGFCSLPTSASSYNINSEMRRELPCLVKAVLESKSIDTREEKQNWFNLYPLMNQQQITNLAIILEKERLKLDFIETKYGEKKEYIKNKTIIRALLEGKFQFEKLASTYIQEEEYTNAGWYFLLAGDVEKSRRYSAYSKDESPPMAAMNYASSFLLQGDYQKAKLEYDKMVQLIEEEYAEAVFDGWLEDLGIFYQVKNFEFDRAAIPFFVVYAKSLENEYFQEEVHPELEEDIICVLEFYKGLENTYFTGLTEELLEDYTL